MIHKYEGRRTKINLLLSTRWKDCEEKTKTTKNFVEKHILVTQALRESRIANDAAISLKLRDLAYSTRLTTHPRVESLSYRLLDYHSLLAYSLSLLPFRRAFRSMVRVSPGGTAYH